MNAEVIEDQHQISMSVGDVEHVSPNINNIGNYNHLNHDAANYTPLDQLNHANSVNLMNPLNTVFGRQQENEDGDYSHSLSSHSHFYMDVIVTSRTVAELDNNI